MCRSKTRENDEELEMNTYYFERLPEIKNKYHVGLLQPGGKVIFTAALWYFGNETGNFLGCEAHLTITNQRIIPGNEQGIWPVDIVEDVVDIRKVVTGRYYEVRDVEKNPSMF